MSRPITSVKGFLGALNGYKPAPDEEVFFRGHEDKAFVLKPSLFRSVNHETNEHLMYMDLLASNPEDFLRDSTAFERLVRMQHYELPTRLLDLSANPLIGLYFACCAKDDKTGEVIVVRVKRELIRYFDSPTVSLFANLARLNKAEKDSLDLSLSKLDFNALSAVKKLCSLVCLERPQFQPEVEPTDLSECLVVRPKLSNARITAQSGAFVLCGSTHEFQASSMVRLDRIRVKDSKKQNILKDLDLLNIGERVVYPAIEKTAKFCKEKYS